MNVFLNLYLIFIIKQLILFQINQIVYYLFQHFNLEKFLSIFIKLHDSLEITHENSVSKFIYNQLASRK